MSTHSHIPTTPRRRERLLNLAEFRRSDSSSLPPSKVIVEESPGETEGNGPGEKTDTGIEPN